MDGWDLLLLAVGGYVAVMMLVRMMKNREQELLREFEVQLANRKRREKRAKDEEASRRATAGNGKRRSA